MYYWEQTDERQNIFKYLVDPHLLISQLMIDPRVPYNNFKIMEQKIRKETGYVGEIKRSLLYRIPEDFSKT